jgi:hypothetical protein
VPDILGWEAKVIQWLHDDASGGLYRLHIDGAPTTKTALVDWGASRAEQLQQLAQQDWVPEYNVAPYFEAIVGGADPNTSVSPLPDGRLYSPLASLSTVVDVLGEDGAVEHPLRRYLWPVLDMSGNLSLDPGERLIATIPIEGAQIAYVSSLDEVKFPKGFLPEYSGDCRLLLTNTRLVIIGKIVMPKHVRDDYSGGKSLALALVSPGGILTPGFDDLLARRRSKKRQRAVENLRPVMHIRFEWLGALINAVSVTQERKPLLVAKPPPKTVISIQPHMLLVGDRFGRVSLSLGKANRQQTDYFIESTLAAAREFTPKLEVAPKETSTAELAPFRRTEGGTKTSELWRIGGGIPYSIPADVTGQLSRLANGSADDG